MSNANKIQYHIAQRARLLKSGPPVRSSDLVVPATGRTESAYRLAMMSLQSDRYQTDPDFRDATDAVLAWSAPGKW